MVPYSVGVFMLGDRQIVTATFTHAERTCHGTDNHGGESRDSTRCRTTAKSCRASESHGKPRATIDCFGRRFAKPPASRDQPNVGQEAHDQLHGNDARTLSAPSKQITTAARALDVHVTRALSPRRRHRKTLRPDGRQALRHGRKPRPPDLR
jgi:hypothetical protein